MRDKLNILWASMWGNAEMVAKKLNHIATEKGIESDLREMDDVSLSELQELKKVAIVTSTTGEGDMPDNGQGFWEDIRDAKDVSLNNLKYGVLALGDMAHDNFCNAGKKVDNQLDKLGAQRVIERQECDGNTDGSIEWSEKFLDIISK